MHNIFDKKLNKDIDMQNASAALRASAEAHRESARSMRKTFLATGVIVLSLVVVVLSVIAWFVNNDMVEARGMTIGAKASKMEVQQIAVFNHDYKKGEKMAVKGQYTSNGYTLTKYDATSSTVPTINMNLLDPIMSSVDHRSMYLVVKVYSDLLQDEETYSSKKIYVEIPCGQKINTKITNSSSTVPISSLIRIGCTLNSSKDSIVAGYISNNKSLYGYKLLKNKDSGFNYTNKQFADTIKNNKTAVNYGRETVEFELSLESTNYEDYKDGIAYVYLKIDYYSALYSRVMQTADLSALDPNSRLKSGINLVDDLGAIKVSIY